MRCWRTASPPERRRQRRVLVLLREQVEQFACTLTGRGNVDVVAVARRWWHSLQASDAPCPVNPRPGGVALLHVGDAAERNGGEP